MEILQIVGEWFSGVWEGIFRTGIGEMTAPQAAIIAGLGYVGLRAAKLVGSSAKKGTVAVGKAVSATAAYVSPKGRASRTVCLHCGRTLDKCVCQSNKGLSFSKRLRKHKLEIKLRKAASK
jgi:polyferredoxin